MQVLNEYVTSKVRNTIKKISNLFTPEIQNNTFNTIGFNDDFEDIGRSTLGDILPTDRGEPKKQKEISAFLLENRQIIQSKLTNVLYSSEFKEFLKSKNVTGFDIDKQPNDFLKNIGEIMWQITCVIFYDFYNKTNDRRRTEEWYNYYFSENGQYNNSDMNDKWKNIIRLYLKGGKALIDITERFINKDYKKQVDLTIPDSDWDYDLVIPIPSDVTQDKDKYEYQKNMYCLFLNTSFKIVCKLVENIFSGNEYDKDINTAQKIKSYIYATDKKDNVLKVFEGEFSAKNSKNFIEQRINDGKCEMISFIIKQYKDKINWNIKKFFTLYFQYLITQVNIGNLIEESYGSSKIQQYQNIYRGYNLSGQNSPKIFMRNLVWYVHNLIRFFSYEENITYMRIKYSASILPNLDVRLARINCYFDIPKYLSDIYSYQSNINFGGLYGYYFNHAVKPKKRYFKDFQTYVFSTFGELIDVGSATAFLYDSKTPDEYKSNPAFQEEVKGSNINNFILPLSPKPRRNRLKNMVIPNYEYQIKDNIIIIGEDEGKKIQKRCARFNKIFTALCLSENIEYVQNNIVTFGKNSIKNAVDNMNKGNRTECLETLEKISLLSSNVRIQYNNNNIEEYVLSYEQKKSNKVLNDALYSKLENIIKIEFRIDAIKFGKYYEDYCKEQGIKFNDTLARKIDVANNIIEKMEKDLRLSSQQKIELLQKLMYFSKNSIEKLSKDFLIKYNVSGNLDKDLSNSLRRCIEKEFEAKYINHEDTISAYTFKKDFKYWFEETTGEDYDRLQNYFETPSVNYVVRLEPKTNYEAAKRNLFRKLTPTLYTIINEVNNNSVMNGYKLIIGGTSAYQYFIDTFNQDMSIFSSNVMDLRLYSFNQRDIDILSNIYEISEKDGNANRSQIESLYNEYKLRMYKKKQEAINLITKKLNQKINNILFRNDIKTDTDIEFIQEAGFYCFQGLVNVEINADNSVNNFNSNQILNTEIPIDIYNENNIKLYPIISNCFLQIKYNDTIEIINIVDVTPSIKETTPYYSLDTKNTILQITKQQIYNQQIGNIDGMGYVNYNENEKNKLRYEYTKNHSGYLYNITMKPDVLGDESFAVKVDTRLFDSNNILRESNVYVFGLGYLVWDSIRSIRYVINSSKQMINADGNLITNNPNDIISEMKRKSIMMYIERYYKLLEALNNPEIYLNCSSFSSFIDKCVTSLQNL